ncbi:MAG: sensor histidine kinase [Hyphomicrobiales bacterium]
MRRGELLRSTAFRLALTFAGLFSFTVVVVLGVVYALTTAELEARIKRGVTANSTSFVSMYNSNGVAALRLVIDRHAEARNDGEMVYLLAGPDGQRLAGNIGTVARFEGWLTIPFEAVPYIAHQTDDADYYHLLGSTIGDHFLVVGRSIDDVEETQEILLVGFGWGLLSVIVIGLGGAAFVGLRARDRIGAVDDVLGAVAAGELGKRIPLKGRGDDIDRISGSINSALDRLEGLVEGMRQISADIAHDLKTPVSRLRQHLETARETSKDTESYARAVDAAIDETDTIVKTFEALLRIAQIEAGARKAKFKPEDLRAILENIVEIYEPVAAEAGHRFSALLPDNGRWEIEGDHELLTQMFANLIENAITHCPSGTNIALALKPSATGPVIRIADNGPGISTTERENVFRRFYRLEKSRTTPGNGLGLSLVAAIADLHGAAVSLDDNAPGLIVTARFKGKAGA